MTVQDKTPKELEKIRIPKTLWTNNLFENLSKKDMRKVFQLKTQSEILLHHFHNKVKAEVFIKFYQTKKIKMKVPWKWKKRNSAVTVKDQNA